MDDGISLNRQSAQGRASHKPRVGLGLLVHSRARASIRLRPAGLLHDEVRGFAPMLFVWIQTRPVRSAVCANIMRRVFPSIRLNTARKTNTDGERAIPEERQSFQNVIFSEEAETEQEGTPDGIGAQDDLV